MTPAVTRKLRAALSLMSFCTQRKSPQARRMRAALPLILCAEENVEGTHGATIGALDDGAYAAALVRHCCDMGYGPRRAREKLREKGVPQELWDEALDELPPDGEQIDRFLQSKLHGRFPEDKEKKRLTDALLRRGFSWGEVRSAWGRYGSEIWEE